MPLSAFDQEPPKDQLPDPLDLLEELLSIAERHKGWFDEREYADWQRISALAADLRDGTEV